MFEGIVSNLQATAGDGYVDISWDSLEGAASYYIYVNGSLLHPGYLSTSYHHAAINGTAVSFAVAGWHSSEGEGAQCSPVEATPIGPPSAPQSFQGWQDANALGITLNWQAPVTDGGGPGTLLYEVFKGGSFYAEIDPFNSGTGFNDQNTVVDQTYSYTVRAKKGSLVGPFAEQTVSITVVARE